MQKIFSQHEIAVLANSCLNAEFIAPAINNSENEKPGQDYSGEKQIFI